MIKCTFKILSIFFLLMLIADTATANPQLKIKDTDLRCDKSFSNNGYSSCTLEVDLMIEDYTYSSKYDNYTYRVECNATFSYLSSGSYISMNNYESDYINIWGTNIRKSLEIKTSFLSSFNPVYRVNVSELSCKVKDVY